MATGGCGLLLLRDGKGGTKHILNLTLFQGLYKEEPFDPTPEWYFGTFKGNMGWFPGGCGLYKVFVLLCVLLVHFCTQQAVFTLKASCRWSQLQR